jgi:gluconokinase
MPAAVLGVDIGTTSAKAVAFDAAGEALATGEAAYELLEPEPGQAVQDPEAVLAAARDAIRAAAPNAAEVAGVAFSSAMHGLLALDHHDRPLTPLVTWADGRAAEQAAWLHAAHPALHGETGTPLHPMSPLAKLRWFSERDPETFDAAHRWAGLKELLLARWGGEWIIDHSCASGTGLLDLRTLEWHQEALGIAHVRAEQLSRPVPETHAIPLRTDELGLPTGTPLIAGGGDGPLANLGLGAMEPGVAAISIGTSGALRVVVEEPRTDPRGRVFCYALVPGRWVVGGAVNNGGVVLEWAGEALAPDLTREELLELAAQAPPGSDGLLMVPALLGERAPSWDPGATATYARLTRRHRREHLVRAALEGVCLQLALVLDAVREAGHEVCELRATGGFARSGLWRQMLADVLGMEVGFASGREASARGAAAIGFQALGIESSIADVAIERTHRPDPDAAAAYAAAKPAFARLSARAIG